MRSNDFGKVREGDMWEIGLGLMVPFVGTILGAGLAFGISGENGRVNRCLSGFAGGAMLAACVWSLLLPALAEGFWPPAVGLVVGMLGLLLPDRWVRRRRGRGLSPQGLLILAVVLHNIPEGLAVGAAYAGVLAGAELTQAEAFGLALGITLQNIPDGAVIVLPLMAEGAGRKKAFLAGVLSGAVEPVAALAMVVFAPMLAGMVPAFMGFAAGAMLYVVVEELVPQMALDSEDGLGTVCFAAGFLMLMGMDVWLG